jgi:hypothetical protein
MVLNSKIESQKKWTCLWKVFFLRFPVKFTGRKKEIGPLKKQHWCRHYITWSKLQFGTWLCRVLCQMMFCEAEVWFVLWLAERETCESAKKTWGIKTHPSSGAWTYQENPFINQLICVSTYLPPQLGLLDTQKTLSYRFLWKNLYEAMVLYRFHEEVLYEALVFD